MTREQLKKHWKFIKAYKNGDNIQTYSITEKKWIDDYDPLFLKCYEYRIKLEQETEQETEQEKKFEVWKWYKAFGLYFKVIQIYDNYVNNKFFSHDILCETITYKGYKSIEIVDNRFYMKEALKNGPLTDLSEIQEYLPNGHVDKIFKEPKYVPFDFLDAEFLIGKTITGKSKETTMAIITLCNYTHICVGYGKITYEELLKYYVFNDGTTCGKIKNK